MEIDFSKQNGLVPAVVQDDGTGEVLMLGFMNRDALGETLRTGRVTFYSRSRQRLWRKGESSGHSLKLRELRVDCDADAVLVRVEPLGPGVCHQGYRSCFFRRLDAAGEAEVVLGRVFDPAAVYDQSQKP